MYYLKASGCEGGMPLARGIRRRSRPRGGEKMGCEQKLPGLVMSTGLLSAALLGWMAPAWAADYKQAPMLDEQVKSGKLPPVASRLPERPYVETMIEGVGKYGGT